ncbi:MAG: hypothetical protein QOE01_361, partial [Actinomycetota bacterium]|nr:hypothetical protein [Actinomycetota bacterium]
MPAGVPAEAPAEVAGDVPADVAVILRQPGRVSRAAGLKIN